MELKQLEPESLWQYFIQLNAIPRASKNEEQVIAFMLDFGKRLGLESIRDHIGNVIIKKPATEGMEHRQTTVLQSHLDMVHQKNTETDFNFKTDGIRMYVEGDWVRAKGTTLGADNGVGVAAIMALLASKDIEHPALEALFTIDEETGMTGAKQIDPENISGTLLLNLDTEEDDELTIGCAGGIDTNTFYGYKTEPVAVDAAAFEISLKGLMGGHSGMDIHKGRANANKLMNRVLFNALKILPLQLNFLEGGSLRNAIPRESYAIVVVPSSRTDAFLAFIDEFKSILQDEFKIIEPGLDITVSETSLPETCVEGLELTKILSALYAVPNGVFRMSPDIENLVEASTNLAKVIVKDGTFITQSLQRSSVESTKVDVAYAVSACFEIMGCEVSRSGDYPGWKPNRDSTLLKLFVGLYKEIFDKEPNVAACHAGLECGILGAHFPKMDMISFGPTIRGAHSPDERVQISSVQKFWKFLVAALRQIPA
jgi:dipeptidase D